MRAAIEELWYGNLAPYEKCGAHDPQIKELVRLMRRNREKLTEELNARQCDVLEKYIGCSDEYVCLMTEQAFCEGFRLACRLVAESLTEAMG